jgi:S1-C subfamily serine protease
MNRLSTDHRFRRVYAGVAAATLALPLMVGAAPATAAATDRGLLGLSAVLPTADQGSSPWESPYSSYSPYGYGGAPYAGYGTSSAALDATDATAEQATGMVFVSTTLDFGAGAGRGTGMVIDSSGIVVTNHHVVEGATEIQVTVASTGQTYEAELVGANADKDVAVLRLEDAAALETVDTSSEGTSPGDAVTAVGDAGGDGGSLTAAPGTVTALHQGVTVDDEEAGGTSELRNVIEVDADIIPGDSGGALLDSDGDVVGMNVAASSGSVDITGYVIPIGRVLRIADRIVAGDDSGATVLGYDAFLGVQLGTGDTAASLAGVVPGSPAETASLAAGDTITAFDGQAVTSAGQLQRLVAAHDPGDTVSVSWSDRKGSHSAEVTLAQAPVA